MNGIYLYFVNKHLSSADNNLNVATERFQVTGCIENIGEKGEIAHLFPQCFPQAFFFNDDHNGGKGKNT